ncbi:MAG: prepilin-type N-terminal cleavage/methylation domain-containing protein [bacterium]|nr:prepilin-type N-terminal cleavage/methylation domain-containing protein [bacterium]
MRKGFTLIEISIALIILGIIAGISLPLLMSTNKTKKIEMARKEMETYKTRLIVYFNEKNTLPGHTASYGLPQPALQIPGKFTLDPVSGIPYRYFADTTSDGDSIYVDGLPIGDIGAVIISAGTNGKFDGENAMPDDKRFQSSGTGDFDDILISVSQNELIGLITSCTSYEVTISNTSGSRIYVFPTKSSSTYSTIPNGNTTTLPNLSPDEYILISTQNTFNTISTNTLNPLKYDKNGNCKVSITVDTITTGVPVFTTDLD